ncbi:hypothetical protein [Corynebacterium sp. A21]|uniref:hypothetical protein n=1 Tax=Corynebacterium sp. A21 TaxID=3457318 RepID=UPI003FCF1173
MAKTTSQDGNPADPKTGRDYLVRYSTSPYQNGTLVLRFASDPSRKQLIDAVANYGVSPHSITDISAQIVPTLAMRQASRHPAPQSNSHRYSQPAPPPSQWVPTTGARPARSSARSTSTAKASIEEPLVKKRFRWGRVLSILIMLFLVFSFINEDARHNGGDVGSISPSSEGAERLSYCVDSLETHRGDSDSPLNLLISNAPTEFPVSPPNAAFLWGCLLAE